MVSVLIPIFNAETTLERALESLAAQTLRDFEAILVDDGSGDDSPRIAAQFAASDSRFRYVARPHRGIVAALRDAVDHANAPCLARMDADDVSLPDRLEGQWAFLKDSSGVALCGSLIRISGPGIGSGRRRYEEWINSLISPADHERELLVECPIPHPTFFMRREAYEQVGGYRDGPWPEDYDLLLRLHRAGFSMAKVPEVLLEWRHRASRLSMTDPRYTEAAFRQIKRAHLFQTFLSSGDSFYQWGAGEVGKRWLREWDRARPEAVVDLHPRKIGFRVHGIPVILPEELPPADSVFIVVAVGARGARDEIRQWLKARGGCELRNFVFVA